MKWFLSFITAVVLIALGGVFSYLDYQANGNHDVQVLLRPTLPAEELREPTATYVPYTAPSLPETQEPANTNTGTTRQEPATSPVQDLALGEQKVKELFTKPNLSAIVVRQRLGITQKLFDLIPLDTSIGSFQVFDVTMGDASLRMFVLIPATGVLRLSTVVQAAQPLVSSGEIQITQITPPYGDAFAYVNVPSDATTVRALMQLDNQIYGFQYSRAVHGTISTLFNAYK